MTLARVLRHLGCPVPTRAKALLLWLAGEGELCDPAGGASAHPLVIPLARDPKRRVVGVLHWPAAPAVLPVVRHGSHGLELLAMSIDDLLHRELAMRDASSKGGTALGGLLTACNRPGTLYTPGAVHTDGMNLAAYLVRHNALSPQFYDQLIARHLAGGDEPAALVTAERACRAFEGWGFPLAALARLYNVLDRQDEARDMALAALHLPVWTLSHPFATVATLAGWKPPITSEPYFNRARNPKVLPADRAAYLMDAVAIEVTPYTPELRAELAELYAQAGLGALAAWVRDPTAIG